MNTHWPTLFPRRTARVAFCAYVALASLANAGSAGADDRAEAQVLFEQGKKLIAQGKAAEACPKFEASARLSQTPGVRLNLVDCWATIGRTASAWAMADEALSLAQKAGDAPAAAAARDRRAALQKRLTYLTVTVANGAMVAGLAVTRDGVPVPPADLGTGVPVDPGEHRIVAEAPGHKPWSTTQTLTQEGATVTVTVPELAADVQPSTPATAAPVQHEQPATGAGGMSTTRKIALAAAAAGVVGLGVGTYFGFDAMSKKNTYESHETGGQCKDSTCQSASHDAYTSGTWSTIAFIAGGALCATGAVMWLAFPGSSTEVAPIASPQTAGLTVRGAW